MDDSKVGFAVIYRFGLHPGKEDQFRRAWEVVTLGIKAERGIPPKWQGMYCRKIAPIWLI